MSAGILITAPGPIVKVGVEVYGYYVGMIASGLLGIDNHLHHQARFTDHGRTKLSLQACRRSHLLTGSLWIQTVISLIHPGIQVIRLGHK
jgi:hypothetical protein